MTSDHTLERRTVRVVVVDDHPDMRLMLRAAMETRDDVELVAEGADGREAIELAAALRPDLLVLDVAMPVLGGIEALPELRAAAPDSRIVMLSAVDEPEYRERARLAGAVAYVGKATPIGSLVDELLRAASLLDSVVLSLSPASSLALERDATSPGQARRFATDLLRTWDAADGNRSVIDTVRLLVTELVTNVVVHTSATPYVTVRLLADRVHVEVYDEASAPPVQRDADVEATSGRGLALIEALSLSWGSTMYDGRKVVWFDVAR